MKGKTHASASLCNRKTLWRSAQQKDTNTLVFFFLVRQSTWKGTVAEKNGNTSRSKLFEFAFASVSIDVHRWGNVQMEKWNTAHQLMFHLQTPLFLPQYEGQPQTIKERLEMTAVLEKRRHRFWLSFFLSVKWLLALFLSSRQGRLQRMISRKKKRERNHARRFFES